MHKLAARDRGSFFLSADGPERVAAPAVCSYRHIIKCFANHDG